MHQSTHLVRAVLAAKMPKLYNIPDWFTAEYEERMHDLNRAIEAVFSDVPITDKEYLGQLLKSNSPEDRSIYEFLTSQSAPVWLGPDRNIGWNVLMTENCYVLLTIMPSYLSSCITVFNSGSSPSEVSDMPSILAETWAVSNKYTVNSDQKFRRRLSCFNDAQISVIKSVLDLIATRSDHHGEAARLCLQEFWNCVAPYY